MSTPLPRGIEVLIKKASVDAEFRELLLADPIKAAVSIELELQPVEQAMLQALPREQLTAVIDRIEIPQIQRRTFLGKSAIAMLLMLTGGVAIGTCSLGCRPEIKGIRSDEVSAPAGVRPDEPEEETVDVDEPEPRPEPPRFSFGMDMLR